MRGREGMNHKESEDGRNWEVWGDRNYDQDNSMRRESMLDKREMYREKYRARTKEEGDMRHWLDTSWHKALEWLPHVWKYKRKYAGHPSKNKIIVSHLQWWHLIGRIEIICHTWSFPLPDIELWWFKVIMASGELTRCWGLSGSSDWG